MRGREPWATRALTSWARRRAAPSRWSMRFWRSTTTTSTPPTTMAAATTRVAATVVRARMLARRANRPLPSAAIGVEPVAHQAHGLDGVAPEGHVDLLAQVPDVDLDDVVTTLEGLVPHMLEDLGFRDDVA